MGTDRGACGGPGRRRTLALLLAGVIAVALFAVPSAFAATFTVTSAGDTDHGGCASDCTLRDAINAANALPGVDTITFDIGVGGSFTIWPFSVLPTITEGVDLDASSQPGYAGAPLITIDNDFLPPSADGLTVDSSGSTIRGFAITRFNRGIVLTGQGHDTVAGNYLGYNGLGAGNTIGVGAYSPSNVIGGPAQGDANVISGNTQTGVDIAVAGGNRVLGNYIGTDPSGTSIAPNGIGVSIASNSNTIGASANGRRNVISGNSNDGVLLDDSSNNLVDFNYIGTDVYGANSVPNGGAGLHFQGGSTPATGNEGSLNVISGNNGFGVFVDTPVPNNAQGLDLSQNLIGTDASGSAALGNGKPGIVIAANGGIGNHSIRNNTIAYNPKGIVVGTGSTRNEFFQNLIHDDIGGGIDLSDNGPTANDSNDDDAGGNDQINTPVLNSVVKHADGSVEVSGTYDGIATAGLSYRLEFYASPTCNLTGAHGQTTFLGTTDVTSDVNGDFTFDLFYDGTNGVAPPGSWITATATDQTQQDETSEFSSCKQALEAEGTTFTVTTTAASGPGSLHDAITAANATPGTDTIAFNIPDAPFVIQPTDASPLPEITDAVVIDGTTQPGFTGTPLIQLDGTLTSAQPNGLDVSAGVDPSTIRGLSITGFGNSGIWLEGAPSLVEGNYIGLTPSGTSVANGSGGFSDGGIVLSSGANTIGGTTAASRNVISGNKGQGIQLGNESGNVIVGNRIGTDPSGTVAVPNTEAGIRFEDVSFQFVGGTAAGAGNLISGNGADGIFLNSGYEFDSARFEGNVIGLASDGKTPLPNGGAGIDVQSVDDVHIGGATAGAGNVISGNGGDGIDIVNSAGAVVQGNLVGVSADGTTAVRNSGTNGLRVDSSDDVLVGGTTASTRNVISGGFGPTGIYLTGSNNGTIAGNYVGTDATGQNALGNGEDIVLDGGSANTTVGGTAPGSGNVVGDSLIGVHLVSGVGDGNRILGNSIGTNAGETATIPNDVAVQLDNTTNAQVGSTAPGGGNVIAGSDDTGIIVFLGSSQNRIVGNYIGTDRSDTLNLGNGTGIRLVNGPADNNLIGPSNVIAHSGTYGIEMDNGSGNRFSANSIHDNGAEGIHLAGGGANNDQTSPALTTATFAGSTTAVAGKLTSAPSTSYFIEYFSTPSCAGQPQGQTYLGFQTVTTDSGGNAFLSFQSGLPGVGDAITATATNASTLDTSEFSACATVTNGYVVNTADDHLDINGCTADDCSLREAIGAANAAGAPQATITFAIPGGGPQQISVTEAPLPDITTPVVIDGTTESGVPPGTMGITLNGDGAGAADGLVLAAGSKGSTIRGLAIRDFSQSGQAGIRIKSDANTIAGDYIGTTADGTGSGANYSGVIVQGGNDNTIGGSTAADRNVISGNLDTGVFVDGTTTGADGNVVSGNYIGVDATGQVKLANVGDPGVWVLNATSTTVGGPTAADGNVISGNFGEVVLGGLSAASTGNSNIVEHNLLGLSADGSISFPDSSSNGVNVYDLGSNVISNNVIASQYQGVDICGSGSNIVSGNTIGTNATHVPDFGVMNQGISILDTPCFNFSPPSGPATGNIVSGNTVLNSSLNGIAFDADANAATGNEVAGTVNGAGVEVNGNGNTIGPNNSLHDNTATFTGLAVDGGTGNTITQNKIDSNFGLGIDLGDDGVTANDPAPDADTGPNNRQNFPLLTSASLLGNGSVRVKGDLTSTPGRTYRIEYFASPACNSSGNGEGATFIGFSLQGTDAAGTLTIDTGAGLTAPVTAGQAITATATDQTTGDTSEFSACVTAADAPQASPFVVNTNADHDDGACTVGDCTLREAINAANAAPGSQIHFDLPAGEATISPASNLPFIAAATTIDASTQAGYAGTPLVTLDGSNVSSDGIGFNVTGDGSTIRGFVITDWSRAGIDINFSNANTIAGNYIGIDVGGIGAQNGDGIFFDQNSDNNTIGGTGPNDRNVISANGHDGIFLTNGEGGTPDNNTIVGNYIGLRPDGTGTQGVSGNVSDGIELAGDSNTIGGSTAAARNYIAGNDDNGITIFGQGNAVKGNVVGLDVNGNPVANSSDGIDVVPFVTDVANVIGGLGAGDGNVISGNSDDGLFLQSPFSAAPPGTIVQGNLIGTDPSGTTAVGNGLHGIETNDGGFNQIDHNTISGNLGDGIYTTGFDSNNNTIAQNMIGTNRAGTAAIPNAQNGVEFDFASGTVDRNVISGNTLAGIKTGGAEPPSTFRTITGNKIGTNAAGTAAIPNQQQGILENGGVLDVIGGTNPGDGNLISGNADEGLVITSFANFTTVEANTIGLNLAGTAALPNSAGVVVSGGSDTTTIGGSLSSGAGNVISGNTGPGISILGAGGDGGIGVYGNLIGTDASGTQPIGNGVGIDSKDSNGVTIGDSGSASGNVISGNAGFGVHIEGDGSSNVVDGNSIGVTTAEGETPDLGNGDDGVHVGPLIHDTIVRSNTIEDNKGAGVAVPEPSTHTIVTANSIDRNTGLGIDLGPAGVTPNDGGDSDGFQNFPTLTSVSTTTISGTLSSTGNLTYNVELFLTPTCDPSGNGEGLQYLGTTQVSTDDGGTGSFTATVPALPAGEFVTATAQNLDGGTSEFSACLSTVPPPVATNLTLTPSTGQTPAGAARVQLSNVPPSVFLQPQSTNQAAPVNDTPVNDTPVNDLPVNDLPVNDLPVNDIGFDSLSLSLPALGDTALSSIPLLRPGGWAKVLSDAPGTPLAGLPLQSVTLRDYYRLGTLVPDQNPETRATNPIAPITLADLDLTHSPLGSLPSSAIVLANVKLSWLRPLTTWCQLFGPTYCTTTNGSDLANTSVMAAAIEGAPVNDTPVNDTPVNDLPVNDVPTGQTPVNEAPVNDLPVNDTPVNDLPVNDTPVNDVPVNDLPVNDTPVNDLPVNDIMAANSTLGNTPVNDLPVNDLAAANTVIFCAAQNPTLPNTVDCTSPTLTLKQAYDAHAIRPGVTLEDLRAAAGPSPNAFDGISIGDLHYWGDITIKDLVDSLAPNTMTLGDYFLLVLRSPTASQGLGWENLNLAGGIAQYSTNGSTVDYNAHFTVQSNGGPNNVPSPLTVKVTLGDGFLYKPGSSHLVQDPATCSAASPSLADPDVTPLPNGGIELKWGITANVGSSYSICFTSRPGIDLGPETSSIDATPGGGATGSAAGGTVDVGDTNEPNNNADATAPELLNDSFYLSYLTSSDDVDYYRFKAPAAGSIVTFHLSHLPTDYDLVVYGPPETQLRPSIAGTMPLDEPPVTDSGADLTHQTDSLPSQSLDDLQLQPNMPLVGVSASRGTDPEDVVAVSPGGSGYYTIQITGYNGATSPDPYMIRVATRPPRQVSPVPPRTITGTAGPALPTTLPTGLNTVFLVNRKQLEGTYGSLGATNVMNAISNDSARFTSLGFPNVTLSVDNATNDTGGAVAAAYAQWNATPGDPVAANRVVQAINAMVDAKIRSQPNGAGLKYLVIVGGDQIIPFARLDDFTVTSANESTYADTFSQGTDLFSSLNLSQMLSDDPYASTAPVPYLTRQLYLPSLSVGRLVETPDDIVRTLNNFVSSTVNGVLTPTTALTTGYDFLYDSSSTINGYLRTRLPAGAGSLLDNPALRGDTWTLTQLVGAFAPTTGSPPSITSLNGHASHYQFQAPTDDAGTRGGILTTGALPISSTLYNNRLVFSMGCHAGLSVADSIVTAAGASTLDWPQAFARRSAGSFLGNTGYGYGDTLVTAYSEELNRLFAQNIAAGAKVGNALTAAKQAYFGELGVFGVYDEKAMAEFTLYGLPMWGVANASGGTGAAAALAADTSAPLQAAATTTQAPAAPTPSTTTSSVITDPATGLSAETFSVAPTPTPVPTPPGTQPPVNVPTYWSDPTDGVQVTHLRPIEPKKLVGLTGTSAHGALITELTSNDLNCVTPAFDRPVFDSSANEPALTFQDLAFPSKIQTVRTYETPQGGKQQLVLVTGQYFSKTCSTDATPPVGVQRLFTHIGGRVFSSSSTDFAAPAYKRIDAVQIGSNAAFTIDVTGNQPASDSVKQVVVGVRSGSASAWTFVNLAQLSPGSTRWTGGTPVSGTNTFEYFVQAVDGHGNVAVSTNKGFYFSGSQAPPPTGGISTDLSGPQVNGWYTQGAGLTIDPIPAVVFDVSVDGGDFKRYDPQAPPTISGDGVHRIDIRASNGGTAVLFVPVDTSPPEVVVNSPVSGGQYVVNAPLTADYFCRDSGSGVTSPCIVRLPNGTPLSNGDTLDTSTVGLHTLTVDAVTDAAGHTTPQRTITYTVGYRKILFMSSRTTGGDIYAMNPDGNGVTQLTGTAGLDEQPAWSPDGSKIAFASMRNDKNGTGLDIYVMNADGSNVVRLTSAKQDDTAPAWSPDGTKIAFQSKRDGDPEIFTMNAADGSNQTQLTFNTKLDIEPNWSPDGRKLAFISDRKGTQNVWTMDASGANQAQITTSTKPDGSPVWSPDGTKIAFDSKRDDNTGSVADLYTVKPDGTSIVRLTNTKKEDVEPAWSRDGRKLVFSSYRDGNPEIYTMPATPNAIQTRLTFNSAADGQPDW
jgi:CSLREA domain-containing protein